MVPRPPARETAEARGVVEVCAMPARRMGCGIRRSWVRGVVSMGRGEVVVAIAMRGWEEGSNEWSGSRRSRRRCAKLNDRN